MADEAKPRQDAPRQETTKAQPSDHDRIVELEKQLAASQTRVAAMTPQSTVATNAGGPGVDHHAASWGLAAQEAANRGEWYDEWGDKPE